jgi:DNA replication protein DnaC
MLLPVTIPASVPVKPGFSREQQFEQWLGTLPPRNCGRHKQTPLTLDRETSQRRSLSVSPSDIWSRRYNHPRLQAFVPDIKEIDNFHPFEACYRCPACRVAYAGCPPEFQETSFDTFDTSTPERASAIAKAREFIAQVNRHKCGSAVFVGLPGTGKTRLACNIIRELNHLAALYVRQAELTAALRATYGNHSLEYMKPPESPLALAQCVAFLVLDEIGCTALANDELRLLDELLKHRYEHRKPTLLISNLPVAGLKQFLGDALADRIQEATGKGKFIFQFSGVSFRRTTRKSYLDGLG